MIDCHYNMPPGCCACSIPGPDFYDSDAQQLAAETAYELFEFSLMRGRRERQWQRLHPSENPFLWALEDGPYDFEVVSGIQLAYRHGHWNPSPVHRLFCLSRLDRDRRKIARGRSLVCNTR